MLEILVKEQCNGCHACFAVCPKQCIQMECDAEGFWYPHVERERCIDCGLCDRTCPVLNSYKSEKNEEIKAYAMINKDEEVREKSSSGGIFTLIAKQIIRTGGVVFGATFAEDFKTVYHIGVQSEAELDKIRGSKYVQSKIGSCYSEVETYLKQGRKVLFTGTPCQIGGLYAYLDREYKNLYTQDIICHGVPSPLVWKKYVEEREKTSASQTQRMFFRYKKYGWKTFAVLFEYSNNTAYVKKHREDLYMRAFLSNICLRPSCYVCSFKMLNKQADITLADFWGIQNVCPEMDDDKGTSLVLCHSEKGEELLEAIQNEIVQKDVDLNVVEKYNVASIRSANKHPKRSEFMKTVQSESVEKVTKRFVKLSLKDRLINFAGKIGMLDTLRKYKKKFIR